jgi:hypothetical protein
VANPGAMTGLQAPGARVWLSKSSEQDAQAALLMGISGSRFWRAHELVGVNTMHPNAIVAEALAAGRHPRTGRLCDHPPRGEVRPAAFGKASRVDFLLEHPELKPPCYVEVKNVHMMRQLGLAEFPDSVTARGAKHLDVNSPKWSPGRRPRRDAVRGPDRLVHVASHSPATSIRPMAAPSTAPVRPGWRRWPGPARSTTERDRILAGRIPIEP